MTGQDTLSQRAKTDLSVFKSLNSFLAGDNVVFLSETPEIANHVYDLVSRLLNNIDLEYKFFPASKKVAFGKTFFISINRVSLERVLNEFDDFSLWVDAAYKEKINLEDIERDMKEIYRKIFKHGPVKYN